MTGASFASDALARPDRLLSLIGRLHEHTAYSDTRR
jgi:hypothetical protein